MTLASPPAGSPVGLPEGLAEALGRCRGGQATAYSLPPACYVDPRVAAVEDEVLFRRGWVGVGRGDRWAGPGAYVAIDVGGVPVVVVRDEDGVLRAHANTCSHRFARVVKGEGTCQRMRCPFHAWTYGLDGRLLGAPSMGRTDGFDRADHGLHGFATAERLGFAFVSLEASPPPIDDWLGDAAAVHTRWDLDSMVTTRRREFTVDCNWKAFAEVFNEYYHLPYVHPGSIDDTYDDPDEPEDVVGAWATHFGSTQGTGGLLEGDQEKALAVIPSLDEREADGVRYSWLFPTLVIATGAEGLWMYEVYPDGPDRCRCAQVVCFPPETVAAEGFAEVAEAYYERFDVAIAEDIPMLERQHRGMGAATGPLSNRQGRFSFLEPNVARFAGWYADRLLSVG